MTLFVHPGFAPQPGLHCCANHPSASVLVPDEHHIQPIAWGGPDTTDNLVKICPNAHRLVHTLLNRYKKEGGEPPWGFQKYFGWYPRMLAAEGWQKTIAHHNSGDRASMAVWTLNLPDL